MKCPAQEFVELLKKRKLTETEYFICENLVRYGCPHQKALEAAFSKLASRLYNERKAFEDPSASEQDRRRWRR